MILAALVKTASNALVRQLYASVLKGVPLAKTTIYALLIIAKILPLGNVSTFLRIAQILWSARLIAVTRIPVNVSMTIAVAIAAPERSATTRPIAATVGPPLWISKTILDSVAPTLILRLDGVPS
jgi:hypothetical protein